MEHMMTWDRKTADQYADCGLHQTGLAVMLVKQHSIEL